jgi:hypothetical protein
VNRVILAMVLASLGGCAQPLPTVHPGPVDLAPPSNVTAAITPPTPQVRITPPPPPAPPPVNYGSLSLKLKTGMSEQQVVALFGQANKADVMTCGSKLAKPWQCKIWYFGSYTSGIDVTFFEGVDGEWRVNDWTSH